MQSVDVGQIIFILDQRKHSLVPGCVYERVVSKTIDGENTHHVVKFQNDKSIVLEKLTTPWFVDIDSAKEFLIEEAKQLIENIAKKANDLAAEKFPGQLNSTAQFSSSLSAAISKPPIVSNGEDLQQPNLKVDLGNGLTGNVRLPDEFLNDNTTS